jgi:pimeloyl-ACP methyl ester carboxylesterase
MDGKIEIASGSRIAYRLTGNSSKPVIVMVNGSIFNYKQFDPVLLPALKDKVGDNFSILNYDYVGISNSSELEGDFDFLTIVREHKELLEVLGIEKAHHFGFSKGSIISFLMAAAHPEFVETIGGYGNPNLERSISQASNNGFSERSQALRSIQGLWQNDVDDANYDMVYDTVFLPVIFPGKNVNTIGKVEKAKNIVVKKKLKPMLMGTKVENLYKLYEYYTKEATDEENMRYINAMKGIKQPTLLMHGEIDHIIPLAASQKLHEWIEGSQLKIFKGFTHSEPVLVKKKGKKLIAEYYNFIKSNI